MKLPKIDILWDMIDARRDGEVLVEMIWRVVKENLPSLVESLKKEIPEMSL